MPCFVLQVLPDWFEIVHTCEDGLREHIFTQLAVLVSIVRQVCQVYPIPFSSPRSIKKIPFLHMWVGLIVLCILRRWFCMWWVWFFFAFSGDILHGGVSIYAKCFFSLFVNSLFAAHSEVLEDIIITGVWTLDITDAPSCKRTEWLPG